MSAEGFYRSPQHWEAITHARPPAINQARCLEVELVVVQIGDPWQITIVLHYIRMAPAVIVQRKLRAWRLEPEVALREAQRRVGERLAMKVA